MYEQKLMQNTFVVSALCASFRSLCILKTASQEMNFQKRRMKKEQKSKVKQKAGDKLCKFRSIFTQEFPVLGKRKYKLSFSTDMRPVALSHNMVQESRKFCRSLPCLTCTRAKPEKVATAVCSRGVNDLLKLCPQF